MDKTHLNPFDNDDDDGGSEEGGVSRGPAPISLMLSTPLDVPRHWKAISYALETSQMDRFVLDTMREHFAVIARLVGDEKPESTGGMGAGLEYLLNENAVERAYLFITRQKAYGTEARIVLLKFFSELFARTLQPVLIHEQILRPLNRLLRSCEGVDNSRELCDAVVCVVHRLCMMVQQTNSLLDLFFTDSKVQQQSKFFVFTQLVPHMHSGGDVGKMARDGLLLCVSLAAQLSASNLGAFITSDSNFCQVLATGLSALYSDLPTSVEIVVDEWQSPLPVIETSVPQLRRFIQSLEFCNSVLQVAPKIVRSSVLTLVKEGFLAQVLGPALLQSSMESGAFATAYLTIFLKHITNPQLMRAFLSYICMGHCDGRSVFKTLLESMGSSDTKLCCVAMELFFSVVDLCCEDVMLLLVLKYLLTGSHVMPNQVKSIASSDVYCQATKQYLQLIPIACLNAETLYLDTVKRAHSPDNSGHVASPPPTSSSPTSSLTIERLSTSSIPTITGPASTNPFDVPPPTTSTTTSTTTTTTRPRSGSNSSCSSHTSLSSVTNPTSSQAHNTGEVQRMVFEYVPLEVDYFAAMEEAQAAIETCASRCRCWSSRYDLCTGGPGHPGKEAEGVTKGEGDLDGNHDDAAVFRSRSATVSQTGRMRNESRLHPSINGNHGDGSLSRTGSISRSGVSPMRTRKLAELKFDEDRAGPFLKVLFERLMNMLSQPPAVNLLLTRLVARLAHYPQPLLRSLLLNHQLVLVFGVPNLFTVLQSIKVSIDSSWRSEEGLEVRLCRARKTMVYWSKVRNEQVDESIGAQIVAEARQLKKQSSLASGLVEETHKTKAAAASGQDEAHKGPSVATGSPKLQRAGKKKRKASTNMLFAMIIFHEFLRELATISQLHASLYPCLHTLKSDQIDF